MEKERIIHERKSFDFEVFDRLMMLDPSREVLAALGRLERTGWVNRGVTHPETVLDHSVALVDFVDEIPEVVGELGLDVQRLKRILYIHDWAESKPRVGDQVTAHLHGEAYVRAVREKREAEHAAMVEICESLGEGSELVMELWLEMEDGTSPEARLGKEIDKLQAILKAAEYQEAGQPVVAQDFIDNARKKNQITNPALVKIVAAIEARFKKT